MPKTIEIDQERVKTDHAYFAKMFMGFEGFDYQNKLDFSSSKTLIRGGRRSGKDKYIINRRIIPFMYTWYCPVRKEFIKKPKIGVYAPGWEEADTFMEIFRESIEDTALRKSIAIDNKFEIKLTNGAHLLCRIASKGSTGKRGRGFDLLYFTEAEFINDSEYAAVRPSRLIGGAPEILASSPNGDENFGARAEASGLYEVHVWKTEMNPLVPPEELELERQICTDIEFRQEYEAERISGVGQAIPNKLIEAMYHGKDIKQITKARQGKTYVAGGDLGRRKDKTTVYVLEIDFPHATIVYYKEFKINKEDPKFWVKVIDHLIFLAISFNIQKMRIDQTGLGDMPVVELKRIMAEKSIPCVVEGVDFSFAEKHKREGIMSTGILKFERQEIHGPMIKPLIAQLRSIRFDTAKKMYVVRGPSPDHVMGLFLALGAIAQSVYYSGSAANVANVENPLLESRSEDDLKEKVSTGYALKASELGPN